MVPYSNAENLNPKPHLVENQDFLPKNKMEVYEKTLKNGLTVMISPNREEPRFYAEIVTRAGSKHDPSTNTGLAHYLEHLLFKGTKNFGTLDFDEEKPLLDQITQLYEDRSKEENSSRRKRFYEEINRVSLEAAKFAIPNEMDRIYSDMGGKGINAHTWHEETVYKVDLPSNRLEHWAKIEAERFANPVFRLFHTELETVYEEKNRSIDNKDRLLHRKVNNLLYKVHPYGQQSTLGTIEHLKNPSITAIEDFYSKHYVPKNMAICISGDVDPDYAFDIIEEYFGSWTCEADLRPEPVWNEVELDGREFVEVRYLGEEQVLMAFRTAPRHHSDYAALRVTDMILDNSVAGLINLNLVEKQLVRSAGCFPQNFNDLGAHYLYGIPKDGQNMNDVENLLLEQVELVKKGEFPDWIIPAVINDFKKSQKEDRERNYKRVELLRDSFLSFVGWEKLDNEIEELEEISKEDVVKVANKYFLSDYVVGFRVDQQHQLPSIEKPEIDPLEIDPDKKSSFMEQVFTLPHQPFEPRFLKQGEDFETRKIASGVTLVHANNPLNDLFNIEVRMEMGYDREPLLPSIKRFLDRSGADGISTGDLKIEWYKLATDFGFGVREHFTSFVLNGLDENFESSLKLSYDLLSKPNISDESWKETKKIMISERDDEQKNPSALSNALAHFHRYGDHSRYLKRPSDQQVLNLSIEEVTNILSDLLNAEKTILYFGPRSIESVATTIRKSFLGQSATTPKTKTKPDRSFAPKENQVFFFHKEMAQSQIRMEFAVGLYQENNIPSTQIFNEYFAGGMAGLVFQELREARALAYSAWANLHTPSRKNEENILIGAIGCQADKTIEAVDAFVGLLNEMPINKARWESAHTSILSSYRTNPISSRKRPGFAYDVHALGLSGDPREKRYETLKNSKVEEFKAFYEEMIQPRSILISVVGDSNKINLNDLSKFGTLSEITVEKLFSR